MKFKTATRMLSLILAVMFITLGFLTSCGDDPNNSNNDSNNNVPANAETPETPEEEEEENKVTTSNLPEKDWGGQEITFLVRGSSFAEWESQDIYAEEEIGEPVNDAVYRRNAILEDKYNFVIKAEGVSEPQSRAEKAVRSGSNDYQVLMCNTQETNNLALRGYLTSLNELQYLDLSREYWDQNSIYGFTVEGNTLFMTGDLSIMANDATWILMFNKKLVKDLGLESPYELVRSDRWTADTMYNIMRYTIKDLNGDGVMKGADDLFGLTTHDSTYDGLFFGMGMRVSSMDSDGIPQLTMNNEKISTVMEKTSLIMGKEVTYNDDWQPIAKCFEEDRALFYGEVLQCVIRRRNMDTDFGVIPFPKLDQTQADFAHMVHVTACMVAVPVSLSDDEKDFAAFVLEAMAAESRNWLVPAYYTTALEGKFMRDEESKDMLDIILRTRRYDLGYVANWGNLYSGYITAVKRASNDFASVWEKYEGAAGTKMEKDIEAYTTIQ